MANKVAPLVARYALRAHDALEAAKLHSFDQCAGPTFDRTAPAGEIRSTPINWENTIATYCSPIVGSLPEGSI